MVAVDTAHKACYLVEVTVVRDGTLEARVAEKVAKYADLKGVLEASAWVQERGLKVHDTVVVAVGVWGSISATTVMGLEATMGFTPEETIAMTQSFRETVLEYNLRPFLPRASRGDTTASYLKQRQRTFAERQRSVKKRGRKGSR